MGANAQPDYMHLARMRGCTIAEEGAPIGRKMKLERVLFTLKFLDPQTSTRWAFRSQIGNKLAHCNTETALLFRRQAIQVAQKCRGLLISRHALLLLLIGNLALKFSHLLIRCAK